MLAARGLKATFFVVGEQLRAHRALAERAVAEGHWIGNHTLTPPAPAGRGATTRCARDRGDAGASSARSRARTGCSAPPARAASSSPGLLNAAAVDALVDGGYTCVLWNAVPGDWEDPSGWVETALRDIATRDWTLLVLHDVAGAGADRLDEFLTRVDVRFRQDFPPACVPIVRGRVVGSLPACSADRPGASTT